MIFTSDNAAGVAPEILEAVRSAATGAAMPYGADDVSARVEAQVREIFEAPNARVFMVATGTAANALALACICPPWGTVYAHSESHIERDECNAPEFYSGAKLTLVDGEHARMQPDLLRELARDAAHPAVHQAQNGALSVTQATERGALYSAQALAELTDIARSFNMQVHMDGTRFANAVARTGASPAEMSWKAGVDILCLGATKNGAMAAEAVILFDPARSWEFELRRKRGGHLFSKMRFVAAQMEAYLTDDLWLRLAAHANRAADRMSAGLAGLPGVRVLNEVGANMLFVEMPRRLEARLAEAGARYYRWPKVQSADGPPDAPIQLRLVCSHATTDAEVDTFTGLLRDA